jgi:nucleoside-diphosphate-sugar epimerase
VFKNLPTDDPHVRHPNISKAKKELGWEPKISLEAGIKKTIEYFK